MSVKSAQGRGKNIALTVYLIAPLAIFTGLCWWAMVSLQARVANQGRMREQPEQQVEAPRVEPEDTDGFLDEAPGNPVETADETGG